MKENKATNAIKTIKDTLSPEKLLEVCCLFWWCRRWTFYKILHRFFLAGSGGSRAAKIASSKTFFNPFFNLQKCKINDEFLCQFIFGLTWVNAEHSTYLTAFNSFASFSPCSNVIGFCLFFASFSNVPFSSRKSICVPTSKNGVFWQWWVISGTH